MGFWLMVFSSFKVVSSSFKMVSSSPLNELRSPFASSIQARTRWGGAASVSTQRPKVFKVSSMAQEIAAGALMRPPSNQANHAGLCGTIASSS